MKSRLTKAALIIGLMTGVAGTAHAEGWYGRADVGASVGGDMFFSTDGGSVTLDMDENFHVSGAVGKAMGNGLRIEGELSYRANDLVPLADNLDVGDITAFTGMVNAYLDFNREGTIRPYVGAGVGYAKLEIDAVNLANPEFIHDDDSVLTYQLMAGVGFALSGNAVVDIGYRHYEAQDLGFDGTDAGIPTLFNSEYQHQSVTAGIRWSF